MGKPIPWDEGFWDLGFILASKRPAPYPKGYGLADYSDGAKWTLGAPRCAQREVRVRQDGPKRSPKEPLGTPRGRRMTPKGAQGEPKVSPRGSQGTKVDA